MLLRQTIETDTPTPYQVFFIDTYLSIKNRINDQLVLASGVAYVNNNFTETGIPLPDSAEVSTLEFVVSNATSTDEKQSYSYVITNLRAGFIYQFRYLTVYHQCFIFTNTFFV